MARRRRRRNRGLPVAGRVGSLAAAVAVAFVAGALLARCSQQKTSAPTTSQARASGHHAVAQVTPAPTPAEAETTAPPERRATPPPVASTAPTMVPLRSAPPRATGSGARLAIIIDDCGQWPDTERALIALPIPITMSILPRTPYSGTIAQAAEAAGKGVMLHLPMQPVSNLDPGPGKITTDMSDAEIASTVRDDLSRVPLARGVNNHEGSKATSDARVMRDVAAVLADENRFFIDSKTSESSVAEQVAAAAGIPVAGRDVFLDNEADVAYTQRQLQEAARVARSEGSAIAIGHPRPTTLAAIRALIPELESGGVTFVLAEDLVQRASSASPPASEASSSPAQRPTDAAP